MDTKTAAAHGNIVPVSHGETVSEILGSGDLAKAHQQFKLRRGPLGYYDDAKGITSSSLEVRVGGVVWAEVENFLTSGPGSQHFIVQLDPDKQARIIFGDGINGSRLLTGHDNIRATYRIADPPLGGVSAGSVSQLVHRPLGIKTAVNLDNMQPGRAPEDESVGRVRGPLRLCALDRLVSLEDYRTFAMTFLGIRKALAEIISTAVGRTILLTVWADEGDAIPSGLAAAILAREGSALPFVIVPATVVAVELATSVECHRTADPKNVCANVRQAIANFLAPGKRAIKSNLSTTEVVRVLHAVDGVVSVIVTRFRMPGSPLRSEVRCVYADGADIRTGTPVGAQLVGVDPSGSEIQVKVRS